MLRSDPKFKEEVFCNGRETESEGTAEAESAEPESAEPESEPEPERAEEAEQEVKKQAVRLNCLFYISDLYRFSNRKEIKNGFLHRLFPDPFQSFLISQKLRLIVIYPFF